MDGWVRAGASPEHVLEGADGEGVVVMVEFEGLVRWGDEDVLTDMDAVRLERGINCTEVRVHEEGGLVVGFVVVPVVFLPLMRTNDDGVVLDGDAGHGVASEAVVVVVIEDDALAVVAVDHVVLYLGVSAPDEGDPGEFVMKEGRILDGAVLEPAVELDAVPSHGVAGGGIVDVNVGARRIVVPPVASGEVDAVGFRSFEDRVADQAVLDEDVVDVVAAHEDAALLVVADGQVVEGDAPETDLRVGVVEGHRLHGPAPDLHVLDGDVVTV